MRTRPPSLLLAAAATACLHAQEPGAKDAKPTAAVEAGPQAPREWLGGAPIWEWRRLTGDWASGRTWLEEHGIEVAGGLTADWSSPWAGGLHPGSTFVTQLDANVAFDLERLIGLPRTRVYLDAMSIHGRGPSSNVGDVQSLSNIQAQSTQQISEAWLETWVGDFRCKLGKVDVNSEFALDEYGGEFLNSSAALSPTIQGTPTYPNPATSVNLFYQPDDSVHVGFGICDGAGAAGFRTGRQGFRGFFESEESDDYFLVGEIGTAWTGGDRWGSGRFALGGWHHTATFTTFDGGTRKGTEGLFATFDQRLWRENPTVAEDRQGIGLFASGGLADDNVAAVAQNLAVGVAWTGLVADRDDDVLGFAILHAKLSHKIGAGTPDDETAFELLYKLQLTPAFSIKPDLQYIRNPGGTGTVDDAWVMSLRFELAF